MSKYRAVNGDILEVGSLCRMRNGRIAEVTGFEDRSHWYSSDGTYYGKSVYMEDRRVIGKAVLSNIDSVQNTSWNHEGYFWSSINENPHDLISRV